MPVFLTVRRSGDPADDRHAIAFGDFGDAMLRERREDDRSAFRFRRHVNILVDHELQLAAFVFVFIGKLHADAELAVGNIADAEVHVPVEEIVGAVIRQLQFRLKTADIELVTARIYADAGLRELVVDPFVLVGSDEHHFRHAQVVTREHMAGIVHFRFARLRIVASKEFGAAMEAQELEPRPVFEMLSKHAIDVVLGAFVPLASFAMFHLVTIFPLSWVTLKGGQSAAEFLWVQVAGAAFGAVGIILSGVIADRIGRRNQLMAGAILIAIFSFSAPFLLDAGGKGQDAYILIGFFILGLTFGQSSGAVSSRFTQYYRYTGAALTSDLAWLIGAAFAPLVALGLASSFGIIFIGGYLISGAICTIAALSLTKVLDQQ